MNRQSADSPANKTLYLAKFEDASNRSRISLISRVNNLFNPSTNQHGAQHCPLVAEAGRKLASADAAFLSFSMKTTRKFLCPEQGAKYSQRNLM